MPDAHDLTRSAAAPADQNVSASADRDETSPATARSGQSGALTFGPPAAPGEVGVLGPYRVVKQLGAGGMGAVFLALDTRLDRKLALKVMLPEFAADGPAKERFLREAKAAAKVSHDNVVTVYEADERDGVPYIAMQFLQGYPLDEYLKKKGNPPLPHVVRIAREAALGLAAAHQHGLVHRDIKPANLWLEAPAGRVKVLDFGLAKPVGSNAELTRSGAVVGTPAYMSPEQARGQKVDHRTDLFSLGGVLYRLCTGQNPFRGESVMAVLMALGTEEPPPVRELNPKVPEPLAELIRQLLAKKPEDRPQTAAEVAKRLRAVHDQFLAPAHQSGSQPVMIPQVVAQPVPVAPMQVTAKPEDAFANLDADEADEPTEAEAEPKRERKPRPTEHKKPERAKGGKGVWVAAGLAALMAVAAAGVVVIKIKNKDGTTTEIKVPEGSTVTVEKNGKKVAQVGSGPEQAKPVPVRPAPAAEWQSLTPGGADADWGKLWAAEGAQDWKLQDGELFNANANRGWIGTKAEYTDFEIELEYKFGAKGNSGIFLRARPGGEISGSEFAEVQLCDDAGYKTGALNCTGAIFKRVEPNPRPVSKLNAWNKAHVTVVGKHVTVTINGTKCVDADVDFPQPKGVIGLQQLDSAVAFRNVRARDLSAVGAKVGDDRAVAEWVLSVGGSVRVRGGEQFIAAAAELPKAPFTLHYVNILDGRAVTDASVAHLQGCAALRFLVLDNAPVTDAGLAHLKELTTLYGLSLNNTRVTDAGLAHFGKCQELQELSLNNTRVTDAGLAHFKDRAKLFRSLYLGGTAVTDAGLANFKGCAGLKALGLSKTAVTDAGLAVFNECTGLKALQLDGTAVTDAGLANFRGCKDLMQLRLDDTRVTDAGLAHLAGLDKLTELLLTKSKVTADGAAKLAKALPQCKITWDGGVIGPAAPGGLLFSGKGDYVTFPTLKYDGTHPLTLEAWFATPPRNDNQRSLFLLGDVESAGVSLEWKIAPDRMSPRKWHLLAHAGGAFQWAEPDAAAPTDRLTHIAGVYDPKDGELRLYLDGKLAASQPAKGPYRASPVPFALGANPGLSGKGFSDFFQGQVTAVRVSKVARYAAEFTPAAKFEPDRDTVALYRCDEGAGDVLKDASGNGHDGKIVGARWAAAAKPAAAFPPLDPKWVEKVRALKPDEQDREVVEELKRRNPGYDGAYLRRKYDHPDPLQAGKFAEVEITSDRAADLTPLRAVTDLRSVVCSPPAGRTGALADLGQFADLPLDKLHVSGNRVRDLAPLRGTSLRLLFFYRNEVADLAPIADLPLISLNCGHNPIATLAPLKSMKALRSLDCSEVAVADLSALRDLPLVKLRLEKVKPADLSVLPVTLTEVTLTPETAGAAVDGLRALKSLKTINGKPAAEFWKKFGAKTP